MSGLCGSGGWGGGMKKTEVNLLDNDGILAIAKEVITAANSVKGVRSSNNAILAFAVRLTGSWKSTVTLTKHHPDQDSFQAISNDCNAILRCMFDAYVQMKWIAGGPKDSDEMGQLYLDFQPVEMYKLIENILPLDDDMSKRLANSPRKKEGHARLKNEFDKVKYKYPKKKGKGVRNQWYEGSLYTLAKDLNMTGEYTWLVRTNNSSVHTGPSAMLRTAGITARQQELFAESTMMRGLAVLAKHCKINLAKSTKMVLDAYTNLSLMKLDQQ